MRLVDRAVLLGEDLILVSLDVASGLPLDGLEKAHRPRYLAACLLAELAVQRQVGWTPDGIRIFDDLPSYHALVGEALQVLRAHPAANPAEAIRLIGSEIRDLQERHYTSLISRGLLHEGGRKRFWLAGARRYPVRSTRARNEALEHLREAAIGTSNSMRSIAMLLLADGIAATLRLLPEHEANEAGARTTALLREVKEDLPLTREWSATQSAIALLVGIAESLPHVL